MVLKNLVLMWNVLGITQPVEYVEYEGCIDSAGGTVLGDWE
ncbi:hypothetical protein [Methanolobus sp. ZRKC5]